MKLLHLAIRLKIQTIIAVSNNLSSDKRHGSLFMAINNFEVFYPTLQIHNCYCFKKLLFYLYIAENQMERAFI